MLHKWKEQKKPQPMKSVRYQTPLTAMLVLLVILFSVVSVAQAKYAQTIPAGSFDLTVLSGEKSYTLADGWTIYGELKKSVTEVVFGEYKDYPQFKVDKGTHVGATNNDQIYLHWNDTKAYILAEDKIMANKNSEAMFGEKNALTKIVFGNFDTTEVTSMANMFNGCSALSSLDLSGFKTEKVTSMSAMFTECSGLTSLDLSGFNTGNVQFMTSMFLNCSGLTSLDLSGFDTTSVIVMDNMFLDCHALSDLDIGSFDTAAVKNMSSMFKGCNSLTALDLSSFTVSDQTNVSYMFQECTNLKTIYAAGDWPKANDDRNMFLDCTALVGGSGTMYNANNVDSSYAKIDEGPNSQKPGYFTAKYNLIPGPAFKEELGDDVTTVTFGYYKDQQMFTSGTGKHIGVTDQDKIYLHKSGTDAYILSNGKIMANADCTRLIADKKKLRKIDFDNFDTSKVVDMTAMLSWAESLQSVDVSGFDTSNVTSMKSMFAVNKTLKEIDVSNFDTSKVTDMTGMFSSNFDLVTLDLTSFDTSNVETMQGMFSDCGKLQSVDLSGFDTSKVTNMSAMFFNCLSLVNLNVTTFDTSNVEKMGSMFYECGELIGLDLSSFDVSNVEDMSSMFYNCDHLTTIYSKDDWNLAEDCNSKDMFYNCNQLVGGNGTKFDSAFIRGSYARIDLGEGSRGYFTDVADKHYTLKDGWGFSEEIYDYSTNVTEIIFGDYEHYPAFKAESGTHVGASLYDQIYLHIDETKAYVLADCKIMANEDSSSMFSYMEALTTINFENFDTSRVTDMSFMFENCSNLMSLDLSCFSTAEVQNTGYMFYECPNLETIYVSEDWHKPDSSDEMFYGCSALKGGSGTPYNDNSTDANRAIIDDPDNNRPGYFTDAAQKPAGKDLVQRENNSTRLLEKEPSDNNDKPEDRQLSPSPTVLQEPNEKASGSM